MPPRRTQAARSQAARDHIAQAALTVFALKGFAGASMEDVCLAAGCSKGGLYHHFRTKGELLRAIVARLAAEGALMPGAADQGVAAAAIGRVLLDIWAEAARDADLREDVRAAYASLDAGTPAGGGGVGLLLRLGALIQALTRPEESRVADAAAALGIERAA
jgi:AcrR family transcriptional regulator